MLDTLMKDIFFNDFVLIRGTAISLQQGHRKSVDIDLTTSFTGTNVTIPSLRDYLTKNYLFNEQYVSSNLMMGYFSVENNYVKCDFMLSEKTASAGDTIIMEGIRMAAIPDIIAMKFNPILGQKNRIKDYYDIAYLLKEYSLNEMMQFFHLRYPQRNELNIMDALSTLPKVVNGQVELASGTVSWTKIKAKITESLQRPKERLAPLNPDKRRGY